MKSVSAVDAKMMMKIAPTIAIASRLVVHSTRGASGLPQPGMSRDDADLEHDRVEHGQRRDLGQAEADDDEAEDHAERDEQLGQREQEALAELADVELLARQLLARSRR